MKNKLQIYDHPDRLEIILPKNWLYQNDIIIENPRFWNELVIKTRANFGQKQALFNGRPVGNTLPTPSPQTHQIDPKYQQLWNEIEKILKHY